jgi:beta-lactamase regulating signal transducer with metallopeptidase domain
MAGIVKGNTLVITAALIAAASLFAGLLRAVRDCRSLRMLSRKLARSSRSTLPASSDVTLVEDDTPFAFTHGLLRPRVYVSRGLTRLLTSIELRAVVEHERHHARRHDPLRILLARAVTAMLFVVPFAWVARDRFLLGLELAADQAAARSVGRSGLAGALLKGIEMPRPAFALSASARFNPTQERIVHLLETESPTTASVAGWRRLAHGGLPFFAAMTLASLEGTRILSTGAVFCVFSCL